jgi:hypothetical protein
MINIENKEIFGKVIADALAKVALNASLATWEVLRWNNAIAKAAAQIEDHGAFMDWQEEKQTLLIWSDRSNNIYEANGVCQCKAFELGQPCWHKAAKQLIKNYYAALELAPLKSGAAVDIAKAPYFQNTLGEKAKPVSVGSIRI